MTVNWHYLTNSGDSAAKTPPPAINKFAKKNVGFLPNLSVRVPNSNPPIINKEVMSSNIITRSLLENKSLTKLFLKLKDEAHYIFTYKK